MYTPTLLTALLLALLPAAAAGAPQWIIVNARIFTADPTRPRAEALAVEDGKISAVGFDADVRPLIGPDTRVVDAGGRLLTPGLTEAHVHLGAGLPLFTPPTLPLTGPGGAPLGPTGDSALAAIAAEARRGGSGWITAFVTPGVVNDRRPWRAALDAASPDRPVMLRGFWGHGTLLNSVALAQLGIGEQSADPIGGWWGRDAAGRLDGRAFEAAENLGWERVAPPDAGRLASVFGEATDRYVRWGVTSVHLINNAKTAALTTTALARLPQGLKWTVYAWGMGQRDLAAAWAELDAVPRPLPGRVRVDGPKWMLDGTPLEQNALRRDDYPGRPGWRGRSNFSDAELREILQRALERPEQPMLHVVGDAETDRLLRAMRDLAPDAAWVAKRLRVEHGDGLRPDTLDAARRLGVVVTQNPTHLAPAGTPAVSQTRTLLASLLRAGIPLALGSDARGPETNPWFNLMLALRNGATGEQLTREQALFAYTAGGAYAERQEKRRGRIAVGLAADLTLLSQDVLTVALEDLPATRSLLTLIDGQAVFEAPGPWTPKGQ
ncbi:amidohydrolase family protein [Piscinibacter sp. XHJ-5]|uniref:amidohydrolase n=1 Tax=Piscinibacter sp. XHJ-5 TaxID=3037797 RepID=UPI002452C784|nr:amidohydrolase family protein [Piscinibacter sp. XHJ-5]